MEVTIVYWGYIGIMENKMETTIVYSESPCLWAWLKTDRVLVGLSILSVPYREHVDTASYKSTGHKFS